MTARLADVPLYPLVVLTIERLCNERPWLANDEIAELFGFPDLTSLLARARACG